MRRVVAGAAAVGVVIAATIAVITLSVERTMTATTGDAHTGTASFAAQTIAVSMLDTMHFLPERLTVKAGSTVAFRVTNSGSVVHEFVVGDQAAQDGHEREMQGPGMGMGSGGSMQDEFNAITVAPGVTKSLTYRFGAAGVSLYGCHEPTHYLLGMHGMIDIVP